MNPGPRQFADARWRSRVATEQQCDEALHALADRLAANGSGRSEGFDRSLSCTIRDLGIVYTGRLKNGRLTDITQSKSREAQIKLTMSSDDLVALVDGTLKMASAWASGRVRVEAGVRDMLKLRTIL
jgi:putative sterol carrier protein